LKVVFPNDFTALRIAMVQEVQKVTGLTCIVEEPQYQNAPRPGLQGNAGPSLPYFSFKVITPAAKSGDDSKDEVSGAIWNSGGVRKMSISFHCYGRSQEEAYNYMSLWQTSLDLENIQQDLRIAGIAVWLIGTVADLSTLLNTGYEGRTQLDVDFGIAFNLTSGLGEMDSAVIDGTVFLGGEGEVDVVVTAP
jgi:hypothetical protein